jgi:hypothetical protein
MTELCQAVSTKAGTASDVEKKTGHPVIWKVKKLDSALSETILNFDDT